MFPIKEASTGYNLGWTHHYEHLCISNIWLIYLVLVETQCVYYLEMWPLHLSPGGSEDQTGTATSEQFFVRGVFAVIDFRVNRGQINKQ